MKTIKYSSVVLLVIVILPFAAIGFVSALIIGAFFTGWNYAKDFVKLCENAI